MIVYLINFVSNLSLFDIYLRISLETFPSSISLIISSNLLLFSNINPFLHHYIQNLEYCN